MFFAEIILRLAKICDRVDSMKKSIAQMHGASNAKNKYRKNDIFKKMTLLDKRPFDSANVKIKEIGSVYNRVST